MVRPGFELTTFRSVNRRSPNFLVHANTFEILLIYLSTAHELAVLSIA